MVQQPLVDEACEAVGVEVPTQRGFIVVFAHPRQERFAPFALSRIPVKERVQNAGAGRAHMPEPPRKLAQRLIRRASLEQNEQSRCQPRPVRP